MEESGERSRQRHRESLGDRPARRHHQLPARHPAFLHLGRRSKRDGETVAGVIYDPITDEMFVAENGGGAFLNDRRLRVSAGASRGGAVRHRHPVPRPADHGLFLRQLGAVMAGARACAASARPRSTSPRSPPAATTAIWENGLSPWDMAAGIVLVREAGGFVTDLGGGRKMFSGGGVLASNAQLHGDLQKLIASAAWYRVQQHPGPSIRPFERQGAAHTSL